MTGEPFTWEDFASLRTDVQRRWIASTGHVSTWGPGYVAEAFLDPMPVVSAPAGSWFLPRPSSEQARRWHLFTGGLSWRPAWTSVKLDAACGWRDHLAPDGLWADEPGEAGACAHCRAAAKRIADQ